MNMNSQNKFDSLAFTRTFSKTITQNKSPEQVKQYQNIFQNSANQFINQPISDWPQWTVNSKQTSDESMDIQQPMTDEEREKERSKWNQINNTPIPKSSKKFLDNQYKNQYFSRGTYQMNNIYQSRNNNKVSLFGSQNNKKLDKLKNSNQSINQNTDSSNIIKPRFSALFSRSGSIY